MSVHLKVTRPPYQVDWESFPEDDVEEIEGGGLGRHEEVREEQVLPARVVHQGKVEASEQALERVL